MIFIPVYRKPITSDELYHFGRKGQKWGVRNGPPYPIDGQKEFTKSLVDAKIKSLNPNSRKTLKLPPNEFGRVMHEITSHFPIGQEDYDVVTKCIGDYVYTFQNYHDGTTFRIIGKDKIID